mgnify:CR=1 FL=1|jgi:hypothetical protein
MINLIEQTKRDMRDQILYIQTKTKAELERKDRDYAIVLNKLKLQLQEAVQQRDLMREDVKAIAKQNEELKRALELKNNEIKKITEDNENDKKKHEKLWDEIIKNISNEKNRAINQMKEQLAKQERDLKEALQKLSLENTELRKSIPHTPNATSSFNFFSSTPPLLLSNLYRPHPP